MSEQNYWQQLHRRRLSRRTMLTASAKAGVGAAGLALVGCGDDDDDDAVADAPVPSTPDDQADQTTDDAADQADDQAAPTDDAADENEAVADAGGPVQGGTIRTFDAGDLASFDGFLTFGYRAFLHGQMAYPMLMKFRTGPDVGLMQFEAEPHLAESYEQVDDTTFTFSIRPDANWEAKEPTNGRTVTGEDVKFAFSGERYDGYPNRGVLLPHLDSIDTPDEKTITFNLNKVVAPFLLYQAHHAGPYTMPPELVEAEGTRGSMVGAGPFTLAQYNIGSKVTYARNEAYFGAPRPYVDNIEMVFVSDPSAIAAALRTGELNATLVSIPQAVVDEIQEDLPDATFLTAGENSIGGTTVDLALEPFNDARVRQALNVAIDRNALLAVTSSLGKGGEWASSLPPLSPWWRNPQEDAELRPFFAYDPQRARQLLDSAGVDEISGINFAVPAGDTYGPIYTERGIVIQQNFADVGVNFELELRAATEHYATTFRGTENDGGAAKTRSVQVIEPDEGFRNMYIGDSPRSPIINGEEMFKDARLTELIDAQLVAPDVESRKAVIDDLQLHLAEQAYLLPDIARASTWYAAPELANANFKGSFTNTYAAMDMWFAT